jgi:zinc D-Ala-D-Ala carboxypeptidase
MMNERMMMSRRYRLRNKTRFLFSMLILALLIAGIVFIIVGVAFNSGRATSKIIITAATQHTAKQVQQSQASSKGSSFIKINHNEEKNSSNQNIDWRLILVNTTHPLPDGYTVQTRAMPNGLQIDERVFDDLMNMLRDGEAQGLSFVICSAYRTVGKQQELFDAQVTVEETKGATHEQAIETTKTKVAVPGTSEHNLGLAVDIVALDYQKLDEGYTNTPECKWLQENSYKYGFIMRYPQDKSEITKIIFEPWHYRYVGKNAANEIKESGVCLEEYLNEAE